MPHRPLLALVQHLEAELAHNTPSVRMNSIERIVQYLSTHDQSIWDTAIPTLALFLVNRLSDRPILESVSKALLFCLEHVIEHRSSQPHSCGIDGDHILTLFLQHTRPSNTDAADSMESFLYREPYHVRNIFYKIFIALVELYPELLRNSANHKSAFLYSALELFKGEKDPRNLLLHFSLYTRISKAGIPDGFQDNEEVLYANLRYFPITFSPPPNDTIGIKAEDLKQSLEDALIELVPYCWEWELQAIMDRLSVSIPTGSFDTKDKRHVQFILRETLVLLAKIIPIYHPSYLMQNAPDIGKDLLQELWISRVDPIGATVDESYLVSKALVSLVVGTIESTITYLENNKESALVPLEGLQKLLLERLEMLLQYPEDRRVSGRIHSMLYIVKRIGELDEEYSFFSREFIRSTLDLIAQRPLITEQLFWNLVLEVIQAKDGTIIAANLQTNRDLYSLLTLRATDLQGFIRDRKDLACIQLWIKSVLAFFTFYRAMDHELEDVLDNILLVVWHELAIEAFIDHRQKLKTKFDTGNPTSLSSELCNTISKIIIYSEEANIGSSQRILSKWIELTWKEGDIKLLSWRKLWSCFICVSGVESLPTQIILLHFNMILNKLREGPSNLRDQIMPLLSTMALILDKAIDFGIKLDHSNIESGINEYVSLLFKNYSDLQASDVDTSALQFHLYILTRAIFLSNPKLTDIIDDSLLDRILYGENPSELLLLVGVTIISSIKEYSDEIDATFIFKCTSKHSEISLSVKTSSHITELLKLYLVKLIVSVIHYKEDYLKVLESAMARDTLLRPMLIKALAFKKDYIYSSEWVNCFFCKPFTFCSKEKIHPINLIMTNIDERFVVDECPIDTDLFYCKQEPDYLETFVHIMLLNITVCLESMDNGMDLEMVASFLISIPKEIFLVELDNAFPILEKVFIFLSDTALGDNTDVFVYIIGILRHLFQNHLKSACIEGFFRDSDKVDRFFSRILSLCGSSVHPGDKSFPSTIRCAALDILSLLPAIFSVYYLDNIKLQKNSLIKTLASLLDDPKRIVRERVTAMRNSWILIPTESFTKGIAD
jgi:hypothetical protein